MATVSSTSIIQSLLSKAPAASDPTAIKSQLNGLLKEAAEYVRQYILAQAQIGHKNKFKPTGDFATETQVSFDLTDGLTIDLPDFAEDVDAGRRPGRFPPAAEILKWVKDYNIQARNSSGKRQISTNQLVFLIQRAIFKNGIKARPFIQDSQEFAEKLAGDIAEKIILPSLIQPLVKEFNK